VITIGLCVAALLGTYAAARRSLPAGFGALLVVGYAYGIVRANQLDGYSHLLFDCALLGLYAARLFSPLSPVERIRLDPLFTWLVVLIGWPIVLFLVPRQDVLVELVGLRGNIFMLPCLVLGASMTRDELYSLACWLAALNIAAGIFGAVQFVVGIEPFFPRNPVTEILYRSGDIAGYSAYRIPSSFTSAHAYAGTMVLTLPLMLAAWMQPTRRPWHHWLFNVAVPISVLAVFATGARLPFVLLLIVAGAALFSAQVRVGHKLRWLFVAAVIVWAVSGEERLQRFATLRESDYVTERIVGSVNIGFFELAATYPMGNGLGGGGTSIPYFLQDRIRNSVGMENEYARVLLEQGIPGLLVWTVFLIWLFTRAPAVDPASRALRQLIRVCGIGVFASGALGVGLLTSIPSTAVLLLSVGWIAVPERQPEHAPASALPAPVAASPYGTR
jgi:hypothetical protein